MMKPIVIFSCLLMILASCSDEGGGRASPPSSDGGLTDDRDGGAADPDAGPRADAGPPDGVTLQNDGDRFRISYPAFAHGKASEYRLYSMRNAIDPSRVMVDRAPPGQLEMFDPYVYDGVSVFYRVYAVVAGSRCLSHTARAPSASIVHPSGSVRVAKTAYVYEPGGEGRGKPTIAPACLFVGHPISTQTSRSSSSWPFQPKSVAAPGARRA